MFIEFLLCLETLLNDLHALNYLILLTIFRDILFVALVLLMKKLGSMNLSFLTQKMAELLFEEF